MSRSPGKPWWFDGRMATVIIRHMFSRRGATAGVLPNSITWADGLITDEFDAHCPEPGHPDMAAKAGEPEKPASNRSARDGDSSKGSGGDRPEDTTPPLVT